MIDKEKENYLAWVFTGAAAQELNNTMQAQAAFQRAIQIQPNQAPAWQVRYHLLLPPAFPFKTDIFGFSGPCSAIWKTGHYWWAAECLQWAEENIRQVNTDEWVWAKGWQLIFVCILSDTNKHYDYSLKYANVLFVLSKFKQVSLKKLVNGVRLSIYQKK